MIRFGIKNFKCFYDASININQLTVLAGANGFGKSSVIQALLFLRRTIEHCAKWDGRKYTAEIDCNLNVELNGAYCLSLGMSNNIIPMEADIKSVLTLQLQSGNDRIGLSYHLNDEKTFLWLNLSENKIEMEGEVEKLPIFNQAFYYLNAERIGPRIAQKIKFHDYPNVGWQGEYTAQILSEDGDKAGDVDSNIVIDKERRFDKNEDSNGALLQQTQLWMQYLMPEVSVSGRIDHKMQCAQIIVENHYTKGDPVVATNIGFGISYVLPIIVTGLIAKPDTIMVVENPEAHLHPSAQSKIGQFLAVIAQSGVNVIVETHSDHVINGIQIATAKHIISKEHVSINFFSQDEINKENRQPSISEITINEKGELSRWPKGFFDQTQLDYVTLLDLRRGNDK